MLLYDRVMECKYLHFKRLRESFRGATPTEVAFGRLMARAVVYEISDVVPLFDDWVRERSKPIPKRPPHETVWCEWTVDEEGFDRWRIGVLIDEITEDKLKAVIGSAANGSDGFRWLDRVQPGDLFYTVQSFKMIERKGYKNTSAGIPTHTPAVGIPANVFSFRSTGEYVGSSMVFPSPKHLTEEGVRELSVFGISPLIMKSAADKYDPFHNFWPPFMAFSLLHCKNVSADTHTPDELTQRRARKAGSPPRTVWRTITIRVPEEAGAGGGSANPDDQPGVKFHLCRGHFKNLRHARFKNPGLHWWPAHWRGDPDLGEVSKDYRISGS